MNRRQMVFFPGAALLATEAIAQTVTEANSARTGLATPSLSTHKILKLSGKYGNAKHSYKVPKSAAKQQKYLGFLTTLLNLNATQQQQAASIFTNARTSNSTLRSTVKTAHESLSDAVKSNDTAAINQASVTIGNFAARKRAAGALANAAFYQILTSDQQVKLAQFQSKNS